MRHNLLILLTLLSLGCNKQKAEEIPVLNELPQFALVDHDGEPFPRSGLEGRLWVADFIFTSCQSSCPVLTAHMRGLQQRVSDVPDASFLSVSVDPETDTPEVLSSYVQENSLRDDNWRFVTGEQEAVEDLVLRGFRVGLDENGNEAEEIMHANHFVLVDRDARIRGYYRANNDGIGKLERDLRALAAAPPQNAR